MKYQFIRLNAKLTKDKKFDEKKIVLVNFELLNLL